MHVLELTTWQDVVECCLIHWYLASQVPCTNLMDVLRNLCAIETDLIIDITFLLDKLHRIRFLTRDGLKCRWAFFLLVDRQILSSSVATTERRQVVLECHAFTSYDSKTHEVGQKINWMKVNNLSPERIYFLWNDVKNKAYMGNLCGNHSGRGQGYRLEMLSLLIYCWSDFCMYSDTCFMKHSLHIVWCRCEIEWSRCIYIRFRNLSGLRAIFPLQTNSTNTLNRSASKTPTTCTQIFKSSPCWKPGVAWIALKRLEQQSGIWMPKKARWIWALDGGNFQNTRTTRHGYAWR